MPKKKVCLQFRSCFAPQASGIFYIRYAVFSIQSKEKQVIATGFVTQLLGLWVCVVLVSGTTGIVSQARVEWINQLDATFQSHFEFVKMTRRLTRLPDFHSPSFWCVGWRSRILNISAISLLPGHHITSYLFYRAIEKSPTSSKSYMKIWSSIEDVWKFLRSTFSAVWGFVFFMLFSRGFLVNFDSFILLLLGCVFH